MLYCINVNVFNARSDLVAEDIIGGKTVCFLIDCESILSVFADKLRQSVAVGIMGGYYRTSRLIVVDLFAGLNFIDGGGVSDVQQYGIA